MTLEEASRLTKTSSEVLWRHIRAGKITFTLISGRSDAGVLLDTDDLIRAGIMQGEPARPVLMEQPVRPASVRVPPMVTRKPKGGLSSIRIGAYTGTAIVGALTVLLIGLLLPSLSGTRSSKTISSGLTSALDPSCEGNPAKEGCEIRASTRSRDPRGPAAVSAAGSTSRSPSVPPDANGTAAQPGPRAASRPQSGTQFQNQPSSAPTGPPAPQGYSPPPNIPSNCSRDVTPALNAWIATVPDTSTVMFPMGACYRIDRTLLISDRLGLTFEGNGATFSGTHNPDGKARHWWVKHSRNISIRNITVRGANPRAGAREDAYVPRMEWQAAFGIWGSENVLLDHVKAYDVYGDFVSIDPMWVGHTPVMPRNVTVQYSHFERNGRQGISITGGEHVTIRRNYIGQVRHALLDLEPEWSVFHIDDVRFTENTTGRVLLLWIANGGICNQGVSNIYVADNVMKGDAGVPIFHSRSDPGCVTRGPFTIERNTLYVRESPLAAIDFTKAHDVIIRANQVYFEYWYNPRILVNLKKSTRVSVLDNVVRADPRDTIIFVKSDPESDYISSGNKKI
jgi:Right handed beta helix region